MELVLDQLIPVLCPQFRGILRNLEHDRSIAHLGIDLNGLEPLGVFFNHIVRQRGEAAVTQTGNHEGAGNHIVDLATAVIQCPVQFQTHVPAFIVADQGNLVCEGIGGSNGAIDSGSQAIQTNRDLCGVGRLPGLHHQNGHGLLNILAGIVTDRSLVFGKFLGKNIMLALAQIVQHGINGGNLTGKQIITNQLLLDLCFGISCGIVFIKFPEEPVQGHGQFNGTIQPFVIGQLRDNDHLGHTVLLRDRGGIAVIAVHKGTAGRTDITALCEFAILSVRNRTAESLIIYVVIQGIQRVAVIAVTVPVKQNMPPQIVIVRNLCLHIVAIQVACQIDKLGYAVAMLVNLNDRLVHINGVLVQFLQLCCQVVQFIQTVAMPDHIPDTVNMGFHIGNAPIGRPNFHPCKYIP